MGGPILGFCAGRIDDIDGSESYDLGPTPEQMVDAPCKVNGQCEKPLGSTTIGLIYLNPEGPMGQPIPEESAGEVRDTFGRMNMNDTETVALIGGGHAFGKTHGACPKGAGPSPKQDPGHAWPGLCGTGKGKDAFTSGFEGPWTTDPTKWDNQYFHNLLHPAGWEPIKGPGGKWMWRLNATSPQAPGAAGGKQDIMMLTSDISLTKDPTGRYQKIIKAYADDQALFERNFANAWYKLTTRDMGPVTRCSGSDTPPAQDWQNPLPHSTSNPADYTAVKASIEETITQDPDYTEGALFVRMAWQCASTYRATDYLGGCNGARLRHSPQKDWPANAALDKALAILKPVKDKYGAGVSWADLIVLAGNVALERGGVEAMPFCGGRSDAEAGTTSDSYLKSRLTGSMYDTAEVLKESIQVMGLTMREMTALNGGGHSLGRMHVAVSGFEGAWTSTPTKVSNEYFVRLLSEDWEPYTVPKTQAMQYKAKGKELFMLKSDLLFRTDAELQAIAQEYASDNQIFLHDFAAAWVKLMNSDRFDGPAGNKCDQPLRIVPEVSPL